jgi:hypothetical protein
MPRIFDVDVGDTRVISRLRVNNPRAATVAVSAGVTRLLWAFDMTSFTDPTEQLRMVIDISTNGGTVWREASISNLTGGAVGRDGLGPRGEIGLPPGTTHVRATLIPMAGTPTVGIWAGAA